MKHFKSHREGMSLIEALVATSMVSIAVISLVTIQARLDKCVTVTAQRVQVTIAQLSLLHTKLLERGAHISDDGTMTEKKQEWPFEQLLYKEKKQVRLVAEGAPTEVPNMVRKSVKATWSAFGHEQEEELVYFCKGEEDAIKRM